MNYKFDLDHWMKKLPWETFSDERNHHRGVPVSGPLDICANEHLRRLLQDQCDWGSPVPTDLFVWGMGEPENRATTKIGGLPYRPRGMEWPVDQGGTPLPFIAQFNFTDSRDLVDVPGDILLLFGIIYQGDFQSKEGDYDSYHLEWQNLTDEPLVESDGVPNNLVWEAEPFHGHIVRVANYPDAKRLTPGEYPILNGIEVWSEDRILSYQGTCIGTTLFMIQPYDAEAPGRPLCVLKSLGPGYYGLEHPWVNVRTPEDLWAERDGSWLLEHYPDPRLGIVDGGAVFISQLENGDLSIHISYG